MLQRLAFRDLDQIANEDLSLFQSGCQVASFEAFNIPTIESCFQKEDSQSEQKSQSSQTKSVDSSGAQDEDSLSGHENENSSTAIQEKATTSQSPSGKIAKKKNKQGSSSEKEKEFDIQALQEEAYHKGLKEGHREAEKKLQATLQVFTKGLEEISRLRESILVQSKQDMISLVMSVVSQIIQIEVLERETIIEETIQKALESAIQSDEYHVKVNPKDYELVNEKKPLFAARLRGLGNIVFETDASIARGGCKVESDQGEVDASLETQFETICNDFKKMIKAESSS
jgi:flagellar assembly protein FliH